MNQTLLKSIKTGLIFALIGAAVAATMPFVVSGLVSMGALGSAGAFGAVSAAGVVHTTGVFALFGLLVPPMEALADKVFGKTAPEHKSCTKKSGDSLTINQDIDVGIDARSVNFVAKLNEQAAQETDATRQV